MPAAIHDFVIEQGATFSKVITVYDTNNALINLTSYTVAMKAKVNKRDAASVIDSGSNMTITLGGALGTITLAMTAVQTAALSFDKAYYDLELTLTETVTRLLKGIITLDKEVTN
jgi:hypothetical protein